MKKFILFMYLLVFTLVLVIAHGEEIVTEINHTENSSNIVVLVENLRSSSTKYIYKDLQIGLRRLKKQATVEMKNHNELSADLFEHYTVVVVVSEKLADTLNENVRVFCLKHKDKDQLVTVSFTRKRNVELVNIPKGVDVMSSASKERYAEPFVIKELSKKVADLL